MKLPAVKLFFTFSLCLALIAALFPQNAHASDHFFLDGSQLSPLWAIPFVCMLLFIALGPLLLPHIWHKHFGKISFFIALLFLIPCAIAEGTNIAVYEFFHVILLEYIPFILLIFALFTVAGGIHLRGTLPCTPLSNTGLLLFGAFIASIMGTTGAAMLLIRPLIQANALRKYKTHSVVFFIFLVANIGGSLTPLGDPPLFLGFLQGVSFFWPFTHLLPLVLFMTISLLIIYFSIDTFFYSKEKQDNPSAHKEQALCIEKEKSTKLSLEGGQNLILLAGIVIIILISGIWQPGNPVSFYDVPMEWQNIIRDIALIAIAGISLVITKKETREKNEFSWEPITEVAKLFFGIFISMIPVIAILKAGEQGALSPLIALVTKDGQPVASLYFLLAGLLSSFLDNAPTYLVFFNIAGSSASPLAGGTIANLLMTDLSHILLAISAGAVFMGANTYIGNAPNFMVRSIAQGAGIPMPSFFGYMAWSIAILGPLYALIAVFYFS